MAIAIDWTGSDVTYAYCMPGFSLHDELAQLVEAHLSPLEALQAATHQAALYLGAPCRLASVLTLSCSMRIRSKTFIV